MPADSLTTRALSCIRSCGEVGASVSDLAVLMDTDTAVLYPPMQRLKSGGLIVRAGWRMGQGHHKRVAMWRAV